MNPWTLTPFADLIVDSRDGEWGESNSKPGLQKCEIVRGTDFSDLYAETNRIPCRWIPAHLVERKRLNVGDIIFEMAGGTAKQSTGRSAILRKSFFERHQSNPVLCASFCRHLRINQEKYNSTFLYYLLQALYTAGYMAIYNIQHTGVSRFQYTTFKKMTRLNFPSLEVQGKIAAVLSAYDDLIENNTRRIAILEKMAEELYREWFVRLRFPGHEKTKIVKGVPEGWEVKRIREVVIRRHFGKIYRKEDLFTKGTVIVLDQSVDEKLGYYDGTPEHFATIQDPIMIFGDHSCKMQLLIRPFSLAENVIPFVGIESVPTPFLYYLIHSSITTTEYKRHWTELVNKEVYLPSYNLRKAFADFSIKHFIMVEKLKSIAREAKEIRDCLLSRLMSGKIDLEHLNIQFPPSMREVEPTHA